MTAPGFEWKRDDFRRELNRSSFAPASIFLGAAARRDLEVFYAFCRGVDNSADDFDAPTGRRYLQQWSLALSKRPQAASPVLVVELWEMCKRRGIPMQLPMELVKGALSDLRPKVAFRSRRDLFQYCHRVAGVVGQACLPIFGVELKLGLEYAEVLGRAFQLINIVRDAAEDTARGRNYFAQADIKRLKSMQAVIVEYAFLARAELLRADALGRNLSKQGLGPSRMMGALYGALLDAMIADGLHVFEKRYRLNRLQKIWIVLREYLR